MLETPYVFLDTQIFVASGFDYDTGRLARLRELVASGRIRLVSTDVTHREILSNIAEALATATGIVQKLRQKGRILATATQPSFGIIFESYDEAVLLSHLSERLQQYEQDTSTLILGTGSCSVDAVFEKYFSRHPPFSEKKKSEFPDAFVLQTLEEWSAAENTSVYVISGDNDTTAACEKSDSLLHLSSAEELFEIIATENAELGELARELVSACMPEVQREVTKKFEWLGFYLEDQSGDVNSVVVDDIEEEDLHIVEIADDIIYFTWNIQVHFTAEISYDDMDTAIYDSEDKVAYPWQTIETEVERSHELSVDGELRFNRWPPHDTTLAGVHLSGVSDIGVTAVEWGE